MRTKLSRIVEIIWIITSILCLLAAVHQSYYEGFTKSYILFIFSFVAFIMYLLRKQMRKSDKNKTME
ncbi:MAG: hypothetical protein GQ564_01700 [Bacteroidales bacterium]|nr:hypothetical protein [Bacteroidales bacterium]